MNSNPAAIDTEFTQNFNGELSPSPAHAGIAPDSDHHASTSWRSILPPHPACQLLPEMSPDELRVLGEDIKKHEGLTSQIAIYIDERKVSWLLDGRNRLDAMELVGIPFQLYKDHHGRWNLDSSEISLLDPVIQIESPANPYSYVLSANVFRRHLSNQDKRDRIAKLLKEDASKSDRHIAEMVNASPTTVGTVRAEMEASTVQVGQLPPKRIGKDGRPRSLPAKRTRNLIRYDLLRRMKLGDETVDRLKDTSLGSAKELDALIFLNRGAPRGKQTEIVRRLVADAVGGKAVSAIAVREAGYIPEDEDHHDVPHYDGEASGDRDPEGAAKPQSTDLTEAELAAALARITLTQFLKIMPTGWQPMLEARVSGHLSAAQLVDLLASRLERDGVNASAPLQKIRKLIDRLQTIDLKALSAADTA